MRRLGRGTRAEARHLRANLAFERLGRAHTARLVRAPADGPDLRQDRVAVADEVHLGVCWDGLSGVREEGVEVEHEGVDFGAPLGGGDEREGRGEVELLRCDVAEEEVLNGVCETEAFRSMRLNIP